MSKFLLPLIIIILFVFNYADAQLITYKQPDCNMVSHAYGVEVRQGKGDWQNAGVYQADVAAKLDAQHVTKKTCFTYFDCSGNVNVRVKVNYSNVRTAIVRPASYGIVPRIRGNFIEFSMKPSQYISLEVNGDIFQNLQLFSNVIEKDRPKAGDPNVIYFGPGVHNIGRMEVPANKTVYIAGGAIVEGGFIMDHVKNINIRGRGILTQYIVRPDQNLSEARPLSHGERDDQMLIQYSENVNVSGIIEVPKGYSVMVGQSKQISISDFKSFSALGNADGIDIFCSSSVAINRIFMRNSDDCIAIYGHRWHYYGNTNNITIDNATLWADVAHPVLIGTHGDTSHPDTLQNIGFHNLVILDQHENQLDYQGCMAINAGDSNLIRNISFENVEVGNIRKGQLFNLRVMFNRKYNTSPGRGIVHIRFKNVSYTGSRANMSVISGYDDLRTVKDVVFENLKINGTLIYDKMTTKPGFYKTGDMANIFIGEHTEGINFITGN
ncbi:MAG: glycosyl hydrolase family 28 protein [Mucilaginibacter sp.]